MPTGVYVRSPELIARITQQILDKPGNPSGNKRSTETKKKIKENHSKYWLGKSKPKKKRERIKDGKRLGQEVLQKVMSGEKQYLKEIIIPVKIVEIGVVTYKQTISNPGQHIQN